MYGYRFEDGLASEVQSMWIINPKKNKVIDHNRKEHEAKLFMAKNQNMNV